MGKPIKKEKEQKNKSKRGDIIFEKIEANGCIDFDESKINCPPRFNINKMVSANYSPSLCEWITQQDYKDKILDYITEKKESSTLEFSKIVEIGVDLGWNFKKMNEKFESMTEITTFTQNETTSFLTTHHLDVCIICQEKKEDFFVFECGHEFCLECSKSYLRTLLTENGPSIVKKTCPMQECKVIKKTNALKNLIH
jgi:hypothetical protein